MSTFGLSIEPDRADPARLDQLTKQLFAELRALGGWTVDRPRTEVPAGAKSGAGGSIGELIVSGTLSAGSLSALAGVLVAWIKRTGARTVTVKRGDDTYTFTALSAGDQRRFIDWFSANVPPPADASPGREQGRSEGV